jgi:hypothetical protein
MYIWYYKAMQSTMCDFLHNSVIVHTFLADPQSLCVKAFFGIIVHKENTVSILLEDFIQPSSTRPSSRKSFSYERDCVLSLIIVRLYTVNMKNFSLSFGFLSWN